MISGSFVVSVTVVVSSGIDDVEDSTVTDVVVALFGEGFVGVGGEGLVDESVAG